MTQIPQYLMAPEEAGHLYGEVRLVHDRYTITGEPAVIEMAKRVFPGSAVKGRGQVTFKANRRAVGDLNWLMLRYPLKIVKRAEYEAHRLNAAAHATRREANVDKVTDGLLPPAAFLGTLLPFQEQGNAFLTLNQRTILADQQGLGKTIQAIAALATVQAWPVCIVTQSHVQLQWQRVLEQFLKLAGAPVLSHRIQGLKPYPLPNVPIVLIHYGLLRGWKNELPDKFKVVIFDEIQELRHGTTDKYSAASLLADSCEYVWGLSGTPVFNYGIEMWSVLNIVDFNCLGSQETFTREWCSGYGSKIVKDPVLLGEHLKREGLLLRRTKAQVQSQLPPKRRVVVPIDSDQNVYARLIANAVQLSSSYHLIKDWNERGRTMRQIENEARQAAGIAKAPFVAAFIKTLLETGEKVLLYAYHHAVHDILQRHLKDFNPVKISGQQTAAEKDAAVRAFAEGQSAVALISLRSAAGIDGLQQAATCVAFSEIDWSPAVHEQCEDRAHRMGMDEGKESILIYYFVSNTGSDEAIQEALGLKISQFVGMMGDKFQTEEEKLLAGQVAEHHLTKVIERLQRAAPAV